MEKRKQLDVEIHLSGDLFLKGAGNGFHWHGVNGGHSQHGALSRVAENGDPRYVFTAYTDIYSHVLRLEQLSSNGKENSVQQ
ncbi:hypothetical protein JTE90_025953 [Oedothorax gibbosus]|uniref:Uncharacterized protein n=1 Tax=Oedothorax gibbosus TaxID=931172 RepID=A0AAV6U2K4_9ARAC|nr:hypothetical protein JTE90_025953 [Oedothorax gibbosus]